MAHLVDHAVRGRVIRQITRAADLVEPEPDQRGALVVVATQRAGDLLDLDGLLCLSHGVLPQSADTSASPPSRRRDCSVETLRLRRAATERGESWFFSASNVARTTLYGLEEPTDLATTSCMPSV